MAPKVADVRERIRKELERTVDQEANRITVETSDRRVTLRGYVHSWPEFAAAGRAAWTVPGVKEVDNELVVA
jgi:osmotically-inducible protein OsmY